MLRAFMLFTLFTIVVVMAAGQVWAETFVPV